MLKDHEFFCGLVCISITLTCVDAKKRVTASQIGSIVAVFRDLLVKHRESINALNVYPVPDGDTGTNMSLTLESVVKSVKDADTIAKVTQGIAHGSLMGARGNSGVIMSQILRGFANTIGAAAEKVQSAVTRNKDETDTATTEVTETSDPTADTAPAHSAADAGTAAETTAAADAAGSDTAGEDEETEAVVWANAFTRAAEAAYGAVQRPVEGTILTVMREAAEAAQATAKATGNLVETLDAARKRGRDALERTPEMLKVLKDAGVVDAGGTGLMLFIDAALHVIDGRPLPEPPAEYISADLDALAAANASDTATQNGAGEAQSNGQVTEGALYDPATQNIADLQYEVMFLLEADDGALPEFRDKWASMGDSIVVVGGEGLYNCHIHTDHIGPSIEAGIEAGRPYRIEVTDLLAELDHKESEQIAEALEGGGSGEGSDGQRRDLILVSDEPVECGVVAVGAGGGIEELFKSLKATAIVTGGQSMNPSTQLLLEAVEKINSNNVVVLPNNKNIIAVARQLDALTDKTVTVVTSRSIVEGCTALLEYDSTIGALENQTEMQNAIDEIISAEVTQAVRSANSDVGAVEIDDYIGIGPDGISAVAKDLIEATTALLAKLVTDEHEIITMVVGEDATEGDVDAVTTWVEKHLGHVEVDLHQGDQPLYHFFFGIE